MWITIISIILDDEYLKKCSLWGPHQFTEHEKAERPVKKCCKYLRVATTQSDFRKRVLKVQKGIIRPIISKRPFRWKKWVNTLLYWEKYTTELIKRSAGILWNLKHRRWIRRSSIHNMACFTFCKSLSKIGLFFHRNISNFCFLNFMDLWSFVNLTCSDCKLILCSKSDDSIIIYVVIVTCFIYSAKMRTLLTEYLGIIQCLNDNV